MVWCLLALVKGQALVQVLAWTAQLRGQRHAGTLEPVPVGAVR